LLIVVWRVTEVCDLGCDFCAYSRMLPRSRAVANPDDVLRFGAVLGDYSAKFGRAVLVSWLGGEPLRWKPAFDVSRVFRVEFGLRVSATTNGTALESESVRRCVAEDFDPLTVSVDGVGPGHDRWRRTTGLYAQLEKNVRRLGELKLERGRSPRLRVNTILMRDNIHDFESLCRAVAGWGADELTFNALGGRDRPEFYAEHCLRPEDVAQFRQSLPGVRERMARLGLTILGSERYLDRLEAFARGEALPVADCRPGQTFLFVDERGMVSPCSYTVEGYGAPLDELRTADDVHRLPERFAASRRAMLAPCFDCPSTQVFGKFAHCETAK